MNFEDVKELLTNELFIKQIKDSGNESNYINRKISKISKMIDEEDYIKLLDYSYNLKENNYFMKLFYDKFIIQSSRLIEKIVDSDISVYIKIDATANYFVNYFYSVPKTKILNFIMKYKDFIYENRIPLQFKFYSLNNDGNEQYLSDIKRMMLKFNKPQYNCRDVNKNGIVIEQNQLNILIIGSILELALDIKKGHFIRNLESLIYEELNIDNMTVATRRNTIATMFKASKVTTVFPEFKKYIDAVISHITDNKKAYTKNIMKIILSEYMTIESLHDILDYLNREGYENSNLEKQIVKIILKEGC